VALKAHGLSWPPDPTSAPYSSIGCNLACNAGGPRALKYGASRDNVLAINMVFQGIDAAAANAAWRARSLSDSILACSSARR